MDNNSYYIEFSKVEDTKKKSLFTKVLEFYGFNQLKKQKEKQPVVKEEKIEDIEIKEEPISEDLLIKEPEKKEIKKKSLFTKTLEFYGFDISKKSKRKEKQPVVKEEKIEDIEIKEEPISEDLLIKETIKKPIKKRVKKAKIRPVKITAEELAKKDNKQPALEPVKIEVIEKSGEEPIILNYIEPIQEEPKKIVFKVEKKDETKTEEKGQLSLDEKVEIQSKSVNNPFIAFPNKNSGKYIKVNRCQELFDNIVAYAHHLDRTMKKNKNIDFTKEMKQLKSIIYELKDVDRENDYDGLLKIDDKINDLKTKILNKMFKFELTVDTYDATRNKNIKKLFLM